MWPISYFFSSESPSFGLLYTLLKPPVYFNKHNLKTHSPSTRRAEQRSMLSAEARAASDGGRGEPSAAADELVRHTRHVPGAQKGEGTTLSHIWP